MQFFFYIRVNVKDQKIGTWIQNDTYHSISDQMRWKKTCDYLTNKKIIFITVMA